MRNSPRKAQFLVPTRRDSPALGMMCLVCPDSECSYFGAYSLYLHLQVDYPDSSIVNVSELYKWNKDNFVPVRDVDGGESISDAADNGQYDVV